MSEFSRRVREEFPSLSPYFFNTAYLGPYPLSAQRAGKETIEKLSDPCSVPFVSWRTIPDQVRGDLAALLQSNPDLISHHGSVSEIISLISLGFPFEEGDIVVVMAGDYPSNVVPWMLNSERMGYSLLPLATELFQDPKALRKALPERTKILNLSHVMFNTGCRFDLVAIGEICKERGILFVADVSQSFGGLVLSQKKWRRVM